VHFHRGQPAKAAFFISRFTCSYFIDIQIIEEGIAYAEHCF